MTRSAGGSALILVGHGSHLNPDSSTPVYEHAERIRATGRFDEVIEAFWKEEPSLRDALDLVVSPVVYVVPLFLAEGYFTRQLLPRELGLDGPLTHRRGQVVRYCPPVGTHPAMEEMILRRATSALDPGTPLSAAALVVIGHGTERSPTSGDTVYRLVEALGAKGIFGRVTCGFLDEEPGIASVLAGVTENEIVLVPFFIAEGWHTRETIPEDLGLTGDRTIRGQQQIRYTPPVGTLPDMADVVLRIVADAGPPDPPARGDAAPDIQLARTTFHRWLGDRQGTDSEVLQALIRREEGGHFTLLHRADADTPSANLRTSGNPRDLLPILRYAPDGRYRPLRSSPDLPTGWAITGLDGDGLWTALSLLYPGAVLSWYRGRANGLEVVDFEPWARRQTAMYATLGQLPPDQLAEIVRGTCDPCLRLRRWRTEAEGGAADELCHSLTNRADAPFDAPCREPCTLFATVAREAAASRAT